MLTEPVEAPTEPAVTSVTPAASCATDDAHHSRGLLAIGLFKLAKSLFFVCMGFGALHFIHADIGEVLLKITTFFHLDGHMADVLQDKADLLTGHKLRQLSLLTFGYAALSLVEGIGLMMEKTWAEYLTLILTIAALPWDLTEFIRHTTWMRGGVVLVNLVVLAYLLWFIRMHRRSAAAK